MIDLGANVELFKYGEMVQRANGKPFYDGKMIKAIEIIERNNKQYFVGTTKEGLQRPITFGEAHTEGMPYHLVKADIEEIVLTAHEAEVIVANGRQVGGNHYKDVTIQPWDVVDTWPTEQQIGFHRANALKYLMRMGTKDNEQQEIEKARHCLDKLIEVLENDK